ncbi:MAG TPA: patatin-like phospholipase family protein [Povalibacter sp.]|uniref:patatin-like phospholipase family protein n=1 Tax=Povalibacter sp. TaxID=1962978 RepID=UPI002CFFDBC6|nr:patatin-like phospholipase family protein [Povalibacter sp.]HMN45180.1 patatin-like phospholipase family protein [Povalibacter sp.]
MGLQSEQEAEWADLPAIVRRLPLFEGLEPELLDGITAQIEWFALPGGTTLFEAGDAPDALYLVISGNLGAYSASAEGHRRLVGTIAAGETVGEMALISGKPRNATVIALRDSELGRLSREAFEQLMLSHPQGLLRVAQLMAQRLDASQNQVRGRRATPRTFAVVPNDKHAHATSFAAQLATHLEHAGRTELVWSQRGADHTSLWFHTVERANEFVVYVCDPGPTSWSKLCLRQADVVLLLAQADSKPADWPAFANHQVRPVAQRTELVLLHKERLLPGVAAAWLDVRPGMPYHHVRGTADIARLARLLTGRGLGIVLSGGGARGFAHIGVLRAVREAGITIDAVGGTSIGAIIAAGFALEWSAEELNRRVYECFVRTNPLNDYTLPLVSLVSGRKVTRLLKREFADLQIEDIPLPFFCVSSNLSTGQLALHRRGELWRWLRASVAIPGVLPPVVHKGELFVDGATINNLPVDVMREAGLGQVIGVDVGSDRAFVTDTVDSDVPPFWKMPQWFRGRKQPVNILQILWRAGMINSAGNRAARHEISDLLLQPPLEQIDMLNWRAFERAVDVGYRHAQQRLSEWQRG